MYWNLDLAIEFKGDQSLSNFYQTFTQDLLQSYKKGKSFCLSGPLGTGKSMTCCSILKRAIEKNRSALYINLNDILNSLYLSGEDKIRARKDLLTSDFLVIDEFDPRYIGTDQAAEFFGRTIEDVLRTRIQNCLPTLLCTNSLKPLEKFKDDIKKALESLFSNITTIPCTGKDHRKVK